MSRKKKGLAIALTAIMVLSVFAIAPATADASTAGNTLIVDQSFTDANEDSDGDNKYVTIQAAVDAANPGDTVEVRDGLYSENVVVNTGDLVIEGAGTSATTVAGTGSNYTVTLGADNIELRDFRLVAPDDGNGALLIYDVVHDSHVKDVLVEDNVLVGNDNTFILAAASPPTGVDQARDLTMRNNEFRGGTPGSMDFGMFLYASDSTMEGNVFSVNASRSSLAVVGPDNTILDTTINYPGYGFSGMLIGPEAKRTTVDTLSVDGHLHEHLHEDPTRGDWLKNGVYVGGNDSSLSNVQVVESHIGIHVASEAFAGNPDVSGVTIADSWGDENRNHDLEIEDASGVTVDTFQAMSEVRPEEDEWSGWNFGPHPSSGANVYVHNGSGHTLTEVTSTSASPIGIAMHNVDDSVVDNAEIVNKVGGKVDLDAGSGGTTGITLANSDDNTIQNSLVANNDRGVAITDGDGNALVGNNPGIHDNTHEGVFLDNATDTLLEDNDIRNNGEGLDVLDSDPVRAKYNNFVDNTQGILARLGSDVDARWNWFGADNGPSGPATDGTLSGDGDSIMKDGSSDLPYDPFLTAPKDDVIQDPAKTQQYAHDFVTHGSQGVQTVASPGPADVQFQFSSGSNAMVWTYDGSFNQVTSANTQADTLEGYIITNLNASENARVVIDFSDSDVATPGSASLDSGWNFVAAPQYGHTEDVMRSTTEILRVAHGYDQFDSQPYPQGTASAFAYPMGSHSDGPRLSAFTGYWVYVDGSGELTAAIPAGVTLTEEPGLIQNP